MSALTPDEEAEHAALTRALFAPDAVATAADQARFAELDAHRRRPAAQTEPALATRGTRPAQSAAVVVPEPPAQGAAEPPAQGSTEPAMRANAEPAVRIETTARAGEDEGTEPRAAEKPQRPQHSRATKAWSAIAGFALATAVILAVQWGLTPRPVLQSTAVEISIEDLPELGVEQNLRIEGMTGSADAQLLLVDTIPGLSMVVMENTDGGVCVFLSADIKTDLDIPISECQYGGGPLILDFPMALFRDGTYPETLLEADMHRLVYRDRTMTLWDNPSSERRDY